MDKQTELQQWIEIADKDFALAEYASKNMWPLPVEQICVRGIVRFTRPQEIVMFF